MRILKKSIAIVRNEIVIGEESRVLGFATLIILVFITYLTFLFSVLGVNVLIAIVVSSTIVLLVALTVIIWTRFHLEREE